MSSPDVFRKRYTALNEQQRRAVDAIDGPVLVIAGPGTGKTELLSVRVANILRKTDANPGNILCLTYTESGQAAMQSRLRNLIGQDAHKIQIHTFHGYGRYIIHSFEEFFPHMQGFQPADDLALYEVLSSCFAQLKPTDPLAGKAFGKWTYLKDALGRISHCKQAGLAPDDVQTLTTTDYDWARQTGSAIAKTFTKEGRLSAKALPKLTAGLQRIVGSSNSDSGLAKECLTSLESAIAEAEASGKTATMSAWKKQWLSSESGKQYFKPYDQLKKLVSFANIYASYETRLQERKLYDYDDMILQALKGLESNAELRSQLQETFQYILADEYQDTNPAQAKIIDIIADNPVNEGRPNVMVVGDDDQAIYGFQGAMGDALMHFRERWQDVTTITLTDNYRSSQGILDAARGVISRGKNRLEDHYEDIDKQLTARSKTEPSKPLQLVAAERDDLLHYVANQAAGLPHDEDMAIVARKHSYLEEIAQILSDMGVHYFYEGKDDLLQDEPLRILLLVAQLCHGIQSKQFHAADLALSELLGYGVLKLPKADAWQLAVHAKLDDTSWWEALDALNSPAAKQLITRAQDACAELDGSDALAFLRGSQELISVDMDKKLLRMKIDALVGHALKYYQRETIRIGELLTYVSLCRDADLRLSAKLESGEPDARIRLLSAHKSKGLEFDNVYVLHADEYTWFKEKGRKNNLSLPENWEYIEPAGESHDDRLRVLYVVLTRGRRNLRLLRSERRHTGKETTAIPGIEELASELIPQKPADETNEQPEEPLDYNWQSWYLPTNDEERRQLKSILAKRLNRYTLSPSHLTAFLDLSRGGPANFFVHYLLGAPTPIIPETLLGSRVHQAFKYMQDKLNIDATLPSKHELARKLADKYDDLLTADEIDYIADIALDFQDATSLLAPGGLAEKSFAGSNLHINDTPVTGVIDLIQYSDNGVTITDYKTGRAFSTWRVSDEYYKQKLHRIKQQLRFYELLLAASPEYKQTESIRSQIAFVQPDKRGNYSILPLESDTEEMLQLKALIKAVWKRITDLDFDLKGIYLESLEGIKAFEDDLIDETKKAT